ncbi:N-6 DNA methylase [Sinorhizobium fredii]|uniref:Eco57I restriction-modification methylase domain-containing protein n=1 Tax=Rhizobium fredii TaxID=380 RepID=UPI0030A10AE5
MLDRALYTDSNTQAHYTNGGGIASFMGALLGSVEGKALLEPAVGQGAFLAHLRGIPAKIDAVDIDASALDHARLSYQGALNLIHGDFIQLATEEGLSLQSPLSHYDAVISNPPYGLKFSKEFRRTLKAKFPGFYVRESYGLFLKLSLERLVDKGRYVFIIPDTFLSSNNHLPLRKFLIEQFSPSHVVLFRSRLFETVQFGYGSFCIIAGDRQQAAQTVHWADLRNENALPNIDGVSWETETASEFAANTGTGWVPPSKRRASKTIHSTTLGDIAECRTGIYTGDNTAYLGFDPLRLQRRANGHPIDWPEQVRLTELTEDEKANGFVNHAYVPLIRGGHREPFEQTFWAIKWDRDAVHHYRTDKKARLQNSRFYFREGIALPMVTSGRLTASYMNNSVFDQGVVGVFPNNVDLLPFLLLYLNSTHVTKVLKGTINPSANNSARYISRIPLPDGYAEMSNNNESYRQILTMPDRKRRLNAIDDAISKLITNQNIS